MVGFCSARIVGFYLVPMALLKADDVQMCFTYQPRRIKFILYG